MSLSLHEKKEKKKMNETENFAIKVQNAIKIYSRNSLEVVALNDLSCNFRKGEISVIMGPSGCGKTTLLNCIGTLSTLSSGDILFNNKSIKNLTDEELDTFRFKNIGIVFQFFNLIDDLTALENVLFVYEMKNDLNSEVRNKAIKMFSQFGIEKKLTQFPTELSGGEQQRVAIISAMINEPKILLCDEPTGEIDSKSKSEILEIFRNIIKENPERAIIIVTHDSDLISIADRLFFIRDGKISHILGPAEIEKNRELLTNKIISTDSKTAIHAIRETIHYLQERLSEQER